MIFLVMKICKCMQGTVLTPKQIEEVLCMLRCHQSRLSNPAVIAMIFILHSCKTCIFGGVAQHLDFLIMLSICACRHASHHSLLALECGPNFTFYGRSTLQTCFPKQRTSPWLTCSHLNLEKVGATNFSCCGTGPSFKKVMLTLESI